MNRLLLAIVVALALSVGVVVAQSPIVFARLVQQSPFYSVSPGWTHLAQTTIGQTGLAETFYSAPSGQLTIVYYEAGRFIQSAVYAPGSGFTHMTQSIYGMSGLQIVLYNTDKPVTNLTILTFDHVPPGPLVTVPTNATCNSAVDPTCYPTRR